tara:strand:+ start:199 stop:1107 length:909 start_codon:yes stop_codon:yes gene_type:complete
MTTYKDIKDRFLAITVWEKNGRRAPHKPLLLLYALGRCANGKPREMPYTTVDQDLRPLLLEFGPVRRHAPHTEYPFWRLQNDGIWQLSESARQCAPRTGHTDARKSELIRLKVCGGFPDEIFKKFTSNRAFLREIARLLLDSHFPASLHTDITNAVGLDLTDAGHTDDAPRDATFRKNVLRTYENRCVVCGLDIQLGDTSICVDGAHIRWHAKKGPDEERNGLALCVIHHKLFDRGAFTLNSECQIIVSAEVRGYAGLDEHLLQFQGRRIRCPIIASHEPGQEFLEWHRREVFHWPERSPRP